MSAPFTNPVKGLMDVVARVVDRSHEVVGDMQVYHNISGIGAESIAVSISRLNEVPTDEQIEALARKLAWVTHKSYFLPDMPEENYPKWEELDEDARKGWIAEARYVYSLLQGRA